MLCQQPRVKFVRKALVFGAYSPAAVRLIHFDKAAVLAGHVRSADSLVRVLAVVAVALFSSASALASQSRAAPLAESGYSTRFLQLAWSDLDLLQLESLSVTHPRGIRLRSSLSASEVMIGVTLDLPPGENQAALDQFRDDLVRGSKLSGKSASWITPERQCKEARRADGKLERVLEGVCIRDLEITAPPYAQVFAIHLNWKGQIRIEGVEFSEIHLSLPAFGVVSGERIRGDVFLEGGGEGSIVRLSTLMKASDPLISAAQGNLSADLSTLLRMDLKSIVGRVTLVVDRPANSNVTLDEQRIDRFPFQTP